MLNNFLSEINHALHYHLLNPYKRITTFIPKAIEWVKVLWDAQTAIEGFNYDGEELVELWLTNHQSAFKPGEIPLIISALMFLRPDLLRGWLDSYETGQSSDYTHPEALEEFESNYGSFIRRSQKSEEPNESCIPSAANPEGPEQEIC